MTKVVLIQGCEAHVAVTASTVMHPFVTNPGPVASIVVPHTIGCARRA